MLLPMEKSKPKKNFQDMVTMIYGAPKIGKSTFCAGLDSPLFLDSENGLNNLECYKVPVDSWETLIAVYEELKAMKNRGKMPYKTLVYDTMDNIKAMCSDYVCKVNKVNHESDLQWGKGYSMIRKELTVLLQKFKSLGLGTVYTSHAQATEIKTRTGSYNRWDTTMDKAARDIVLPSCDFILFAESITDNTGEKRVLHTKPADTWNAGDRTGMLPPTLPLDAAEFLKIFNTTMGGKER